MSGKMVRGALVVAAMLAFTGAKPVAMRLDVTGKPEGAEVAVDGKKIGTLQDSATCTATQLAPGLHLLHVEAPHHWPLDKYVRLDESRNFVEETVALRPMYGIVLVKTTPDGATVSYRNIDYGKTPLLLTKLPCGQTHMLELSLNGYKKKRVNISVPDRRPVVCNEELELDSGLLHCTSEPNGATVLKDGLEQDKVTPTDVMIPRSGVKLTFRLNGYKDETRIVSVPAGEKRELHVPMQGLPARLVVVTEPEGAKIYLGDHFRGKSPVPIDAVSPGAHKIRAELPGYAVATRAVEVANGGDTTETLKLESILGRIQVSTVPSGAKVSLDGRGKGTTDSGILTIEDVEVGEHTVEINLSRFHSQSHKVTVRAKDTVQLLDIELKPDNSPDTEVELNDGTPVRGVLKRQDAEQVVLETRNGVDRPIPRANIRKVVDIKTGVELPVPSADARPAADSRK